MMILLYIAVFVFGLCIGSFLNCLTYRLEKAGGFVEGRSKKKTGFFMGRSFCPKCKHKLGASDLIPIVSFLMLKGKCRYCKKKISSQYLLVEVFVGLLFVLILQHITGGFLIISPVFVLWFLYLVVVFSLLVVIFLFDLKHYIIPDVIIYPAIAAALLFRIAGVFIFGIRTNITSALISAVCASMFFFIIWLVSRGKWMGFGDVKLAFFMGLFLGWPNILVALFLAFLIGSLVGLVLISLAKKKFKSEVPFGPFLIIGTLLALFWGHNLINWYLGLLQ